MLHQRGPSTSRCASTAGARARPSAACAWRCSATCTNCPPWATTWQASPSTWSCSSAAPSSSACRARRRRRHVADRARAVFRQKDAALLDVLKQDPRGRGGGGGPGSAQQPRAPDPHAVRRRARRDPHPHQRRGRTHQRSLSQGPARCAVGTYQAATTGEFSQTAQPTDATLMLKVGAKVMLLRNDPGPALGERHHRPRPRLEEDRIWNPG